MPGLSFTHEMSWESTGGWESCSSWLAGLLGGISGQQQSMDSRLGAEQNEAGGEQRGQRGWHGGCGQGWAAGQLLLQLCCWGGWRGLGAAMGQAQGIWGWEWGESKVMWGGKMG